MHFCHSFLKMIDAGCLNFDNIFIYLYAAFSKSNQNPIIIHFYFYPALSRDDGISKTAEENCVISFIFMDDKKTEFKHETSLDIVHRKVFQKYTSCSIFQFYILRKVKCISEENLFSY